MRDYSRRYSQERKDQINARRRERSASDPAYIERRKRERRKWYSNNQEYIKAKTNAYYHGNKEMVKVRHSAYRRERRKADPAFALATIVPRSVYKRLPSSECPIPLKEAMGCTWEELATYIESLFKPCMTWQNRGYGSGVVGWHIDHKKPLASFDLTDREQFLEACHYTNLQPLWWHENLAKGSKILPAVHGK